MNKLFFVALFLALALAQTDDCLTYSYATPAVNRIVSLSFASATTAATINSILSSLLSIAKTTSSPFVQNIYVGQSGTNDFYMIKNCFNQQGPNDFCTSNGPQYLAYVRNTAVFSDNVRHVFSAAGTIDVAGTALGKETAAYETSTRSWFTTNGWTDVITFASGGQGKIYVKPFGTGLVAAADRPLTEYCGPCLSNSYAVAVSQALAVTDFSAGLAGIKTAADLSIISKAMKTAMDAVNSPYTVNGLLGFNNGDSYMVKYCNKLGGTGASECKDHEFLFYVSNVAVYGDNTRRALSLSSDGTAGVVVSTLSAYDVTTRGWFQAQNGWSDTYTFASSASIQGRTYSLAINGGVVGTDRVSSEPCSSNNCNQETSDASKFMASLFVLAIALVAMF